MPEHQPSNAEKDAAELSRLLFEAREQIEMWADVVEARAGKPANYVRDLVERIDLYRAARGWDPDGFGGESVFPPGSTDAYERGQRDLAAKVEALIPVFERDYGIQSSPVSRLRTLLANIQTLEDK